MKSTITHKAGDLDVLQHTMFLLWDGGEYLGPSIPCLAQQGSIGMSKETYKSGATRNPIAPVRYDLVKWGFVREMAKVMHEGAESHGGPGSDGNWEKGLPRSSTINHMMEHWHHWLEGDRSEPHLAKMAFGLMALWWYESKGIEVKE